MALNVTSFPLLGLIRLPRCSPNYRHRQPNLSVEFLSVLSYWPIIRYRDRSSGVTAALMASTLLLVVVFIFDLIAFALAVAAEQRRSKATLIPDAQNNHYYCTYESDIATGLGAGSFLFLMASQVLIMVASRCLCCGRALNRGSSRVWAIVLFITCWVTFFIAEVCLLAGSVRNAYHTKYRNEIFGNKSPSCETLRKGIFGAGAAFIVFTGIVTEFYYVCYSNAKDAFKPTHGRDTGVAMGSYS